MERVVNSSLLRRYYSSVAYFVQQVQRVLQHLRERGLDGRVAVDLVAHVTAREQTEQRQLGSTRVLQLGLVVDEVVAELTSTLFVRLLSIHMSDLNIYTRACLRGRYHRRRQA